MTAWLDRAQRSGSQPDEALAAFDDCEPVATAALIGRWRGHGLHTGHPLDGALEALGWYGKAFEDEERAFPLLFGAGDDVFAVDPRFLPIGLVLRRRLHESRLARAGFGLYKRLMRTSRPSARLRMVDYRGKASATMLYDALPINDIFRRAGDDTLMGLMDLRGQARPFFFILWRVS